MKNTIESNIKIPAIRTSDPDKEEKTQVLIIGFVEMNANLFAIDIDILTGQIDYHNVGLYKAILNE